MRLNLFPFLLFVSGVLTAQSVSPFTATGNMTYARYGHTATLLPDGHVLIAGGRGGDLGSPLLASAELYDLANARFTPTSNMTIARGGHTATLLANGRVLIAGGSGDASAELYDPANRTFTPTGRMTMPRGADHSATVLRDGRVLIAGGAGLTAEIYDPTTGTFSPTGSMRDPGDAEAGILFPDGTVLAGTEVYDPATGAFTVTADAGHDFGYTETLLTSGKAFIAGGGDSDPEKCLSQTELYDAVTVTFTVAPRMTLCRFSHTATLLPTGIVLIAGGGSYDAGPYQANLASAEIYDFSTNTFGWIGNMNEGRQVHTATLLPDGRVLIAGGVGAPGYSALATAEVYTPPTLITAPKLFSLSANGGQGAIWHAETGQIASSSSPAIAGDILSLYTTSLVDGGAIAPQVAIGGRAGEILFFGKAPGYPGYNQVNFRVPNGIAPGSVIPVRLTYLDRPSNEVTIALQ